MARYFDDDDDDIRVSGLYGQSRDQESMNLLAGHEEILGMEEILGALGLSSKALKQSPELRSALARKLAQRAPVTQRVAPPKKRRWPLGFSGSGAAGTTVNISTRPQCLFRGEKIIATDSGANAAGTNTRITGIFVGNKPQLPSFQANILTSTFASGSLDNELLMDTADPAIDITFQVSFVVAATFEATVFGHSVQ